MYRSIVILLTTMIMVGSSTQYCVKLTGKSDYCSNMPAKVCSLNKDPIDAAQYNYEVYNSNAANFNPTLDCPANKFASYMDPLTFCNYNMPCQSDKDCLPFCYSSCTSCQNVTECNRLVKSGQYAAKGAGPCYLPGSRGQSTLIKQNDTTSSSHPTASTAPTKKPVTPKPTTNEDGGLISDPRATVTPKAEWKPKTPKPEPTEAPATSPKKQKNKPSNNDDMNSDDLSLSSESGSSSDATLVSIPMFTLVFAIVFSLF
ncbi:hypothetical protein PPL_08608 [Heterostelium album PN500]|uniref:Uncharacterized protein n=1 Tax=Heterostelium pallidum (strain ATCC 26659 / Pp 5 / PN500) TaxID=670386 RepID=D3BJ83_HETP5|nr:hypothetical protein PPL_08608 [Heterostelium album PN500]EFA77963.1 hypothetical protein PPL_08608 [Heterostelium album PN500]|eukprot:XP_020430091.1 hypothetical protein PPL_08608 [Heterostelium album PN500]